MVIYYDTYVCILYILQYTAQIEITQLLRMNGIIKNLRVSKSHFNPQRKFKKETRKDEEVKQNTQDVNSLYLILYFNVHDF